MLDVYDVIAMPFTLSFFALPATVAVVAMGAWANRVNRRDVVRRMWVGVVAGAAGTAVYDLSRLVVAWATPASFDPFRAHPNFGALMLSTTPDQTAAIVAGWGYHFWNGLSFAVMFALIAGAARARWAVLWALVLESATIMVTPRYTGISQTDVAFISVSLVGHLFYGIVLGLLARQWLMADPGGSPLRLTRPSYEGSLW
ncbi:MAG: hypothetical protein GY720_03745 [bacterium]|nr:hypothetical protein [bacterium]